jgi:hypothetical protein
MLRQEDLYSNFQAGLSYSETLPQKNPGYNNNNNKGSNDQITTFKRLNLRRKYRSKSLQS